MHSNICFHVPLVAKLLNSVIVVTCYVQYGTTIVIKTPALRVLFEDDSSSYRSGGDYLSTEVRSHEYSDVYNDSPPWPACPSFVSCAVIILEWHLMRVVNWTP